MRLIHVLALLSRTSPPQSISVQGNKNKPKTIVEKLMKTMHNTQKKQFNNISTGMRQNKWARGQKCLLRQLCYSYYIGWLPPCPAPGLLMRCRCSFHRAYTFYVKWKHSHTFGETTIQNCKRLRWPIEKGVFYTRLIRYFGVNFSGFIE